MYFPVVSVPVQFQQFVEKLSSYLHKPEVNNLARYCTGLCSMANKTAQGVCSMLMNAPTSSSLSDFVSRGKWDADITNEERIKIVKKRYLHSSKRHGTLVVDDLLSEKTGKHIALCGRHFDHIEGRSKWGHRFVSSLLFHRDGITPVDLKIFLREKDCPRYGWTFKTKNQLFRETVDEAVEWQLPFDCVVFDVWYTSRENIDHITDEKELSCVFTVKKNRKMKWNGKEMPLSDWYRDYGRELPHKTVEINPYHDTEKLYHVTVRNLYICCLKRKVKVVVSHEGEEIGDDPKFLGTNRLDWNARFILTRHSYRWPIEPMHRDFKQHLGLESCEMRSKEAVLHHSAAVLLSATILDEMVRESGMMHWAIGQKSTAVAKKQRFLLHSLMKEFILWILGFVNADESKAEEIFDALKRNLNNPELEKQLSQLSPEKKDEKIP
jgi:SRSO17 transposase